MSLFAETTDGVEPPSPGPTGRWYLHRGGILNVWQYDRVELRFAGGRMLLRGKNGAGKSKALEVLLPFLLDGDTRRLDAVGRDRTTVRWLMTEGRNPGHHVGYVWLELRSVDDDGVESYRTLGAGLRASTSTGRSDQWFFMTNRRVGVDLVLDVAGECLSADRLKAEIGEEAVTSSGAEHRRRIGRQVFGLRDEARYDNLLHLLHRLRDPNIGERVDKGELAAVLADALPPLDDRVLQDAATRFDDLELVREQVERSTQVAGALGEFLDIYRDYAGTALRRRASDVEQAERRRSGCARTTGDLRRRHEEARQHLEHARDTLKSLRGQRDAALGERQALEDSDEYRAHRDLTDRERTVAALRAASAASGRAEAQAREVWRRAEQDLDDTHQEVDEITAGVRDHTATSRTAVSPAGLDPQLVGAAPTFSGVESLDVTTTELDEARQRAGALHEALAARRRIAQHVRQLAVVAAKADREAKEAEGRAAESEAELADRQRELDDCEQAARAAVEAWAAAITTWAAEPLPATSAIDWSGLTALFEPPVGDPAWVDEVRRAATGALQPAIDEARGAAAHAQAAVVTAEAELAEAREALEALEAETEARPNPPPHRRAERDPARGAPFYELVDFRSHLSEDDRAGIEAALGASGLLDAWVGADGVVMHPRTEDVVVRADLDPGVGHGAALAAALVPAPPPDCPVGPETIERVLRSVALGEQPQASAWMAADGRWSMGALRGAWSKPEVEYVGAGARAATRQRRIDEARVLVGRRTVTRDRAISVAEAAADRRSALEARPGSLPPSDTVSDAYAEVAGAIKAVNAARDRHQRDHRRALEKRGEAARTQADLDHAAHPAGLPTDVADVDTILQALQDATTAVIQWGTALHGLARALPKLAGRAQNVAARLAELDEATGHAQTDRERHRLAQQELDELRAALGAPIEAVMRRHAEVVSRLETLEVEIPRADDAKEAAVVEESRVGSEYDRAAADERDAEAEVVARGRLLTRAIGLPGLAMAAFGRDVANPLDLLPASNAGPSRFDHPAAARLAREVARLVEAGQEVSDGLLLARYDRLQQALSGGYDTILDEDDVVGIKTVQIADETGRQALAVVAVQVQAEADRARQRLADQEREVLERFLMHDLAEELRTKLLDAVDLVDGANRALAGVETSHGKGVHLDWELRDDSGPAARTAAKLLHGGLRNDEEDAALRQALTALIDAERDADPSRGYEAYLSAALDYRSWHRFVVKVTDAAKPGSRRVLSARLGLSQGEQRVLSYLALFAAAAAQFDGIGRETPTAPRLLLLDDAFAKVDEPTHGHLLRLLVELDLDFVLTSERLWGCFPGVPSLEIYEAVRDPATPGVALIRFHWDGHQRHLVGV